MVNLTQVILILFQYVIICVIFWEKSLYVNYSIQGNIPILETDKLLNVEILGHLRTYLENCWDILEDLKKGKV